MRTISTFLFSLLLIGTFSAFVLAQETGDAKVVDEVVAQVNDNVITLSRVKREMKNAVDSFVEQGKTREEAQKLVDDRQGELIANLINEELLIQKAKELGMEADIDAELNQRTLELMKQYNCKAVECLNALIEKSGADPKDLRDSWRKDATRDRVLQREVQSKIYTGLTTKEIKDYFDANKAKFAKSETVSFSELFLGFAGKDESAVREKAKQLDAQLKSGADFAKLVADNGDKPVVTDGTGKVEKIEVKPLNDIIKKPLEGVAVGQYTNPIEIDQLGMAILRVDARDAASSESTFDDNAVRMAMVSDRFPDAQKKYLVQLRDDSYIKVNDTYRPLVAPLLRADNVVSKPTK